MKNVVKNIAVTLCFLYTSYLLACDTCKLRQPKVTQNLTHGAGPESDWDWFIVAIAIAITLLAFFYSVKYLVKPGEKNKNHIKYSFLE